MSSSELQGYEFYPGQGGCSQARPMPDKDAWRAHGGAMSRTESFVRRRFATPRAVFRWEDRPQTTAEVSDFLVSHFTLNLNVGSKGLFENLPNLCWPPKNVNTKPHNVSIKIPTQNDRAANQSPILEAPRGKSTKREHTGHSLAQLANRNRVGRH